VVFMLETTERNGKTYHNLEALELA
jgi:hypothetical protein